VFAACAAGGAAVVSFSRLAGRSGNSDRVREQGGSR
jgi:hypothetical protein